MLSQEIVMKKLLLLLITMIFLTVSCGSSKKAENDADILPDEDAVDRSSLINICTGQTECYNNEKEAICPVENENFYGQDAQYTASGSCVPQKFSIDDSVENEPTVIDKNSGLEWQQRFSKLTENCENTGVWDGLPHTTAESYCENLKYGGHDDWRVPTILELNSIVDRGKNSPAINTVYFPDTPSGYFFSSSLDHLHDGYESFYVIWSIDFKDGVIDLESFDSLLELNDEHYVRCVRGEKSEKIHLKHRDLGDSERIYIDSKSPKSKIFLALFYEPVSDWENALKYCENKTYGGLSTWRLPNISELAFFFLDNFFWHEKEEMNLWSSTSYTADPTKSWILKRDEKKQLFVVPVSKKSQTSDYYTLCVSDSPCKGDAAWNGTECIDLCDPDPCKDMEYSTGKCIQSYEETNRDSYECECVENAVWDEYGKKKCVTPCDPNPCENKKLSTGVCIILGSLDLYKCECEENYCWSSRGECTDGSDGSCN